ncbi:MAG: AAA family ATPase [Myxococcales bacterium]|nr:AAA family ATPase [Myxococcales bacterium]
MPPDEPHAHCVPPLAAAQLRWRCDPQALPFATTAEVEPIPGIVGQDRAVEALRFGIEIHAKGQNVYVRGLQGTGRLTMVRRLLEEIRPTPCTAPDHLYVHDFERPDHPMRLTVERGRGELLVEKLGELRRFIVGELREALESDAVRAQERELQRASLREIEALTGPLEQQLHDKGLALLVGQAGGVARPLIMPLVDGQPVPILGGAKVYGRSGPVSYGVLQVQTLGAPDDPARGLSRSEPANVTVGRIRVQTTRTLNVGLMALGQHRFGIDHGDHAAGGVDAQLVGLDGKLFGYGFLAGTLGQQPAQPEQRDPDPREGGRRIAAARPPGQDLGSSASAQLQYRGLYVRPALLWLWSDEDFDPRLGFYRRPGSSRQEASLTFVPRPRVLGLREVSFGPSYSVETDPGYRHILLRSGTGQIDARWRNDAGVGYGVTHYIDRVQQPFELYQYEVEARRYTGFRHGVSANSPGRRALQVGADYEWAELFGGVAHLPSASVTARLGRHFTFGGRYTHVVGALADEGEDFDFGFANANLDVAITRNLAFDNLGRFDLSPGARRVGTQSRLRWRFAPGSDLFVVYRNDLPLDDGTPDAPRVPFHEVTVKLSYYLRAFVRR